MNGSANKLIISKLVNAFSKRPLFQPLACIVRPWSSANCPPAKDVFETRSFIDDTISAPLTLRKVIIFNKRTRYEFEKMLANQQTEAEFERYIKFLGSDYKKLLDQHILHHTHLKRVIGVLEKLGVNVSMVSRSDFDTERLTDVDAIITTGGDGTFLQAASFIKSNSVPVIGINTDPYQSQGHLCLPALQMEEIYDRLKAGHYRWLHRHRIEVSLSANESVEVTDLHIPGRPSFEYPVSALPPDPEIPGFVCLPLLALNELFIGENNNALTSYYELSFDNAPVFKQKSSGLTLSTGTGSTSWYHTITSLHPETVRQLLALANHVAVGIGSNQTLPVRDLNYVRRVCQTYNKQLQFHPEDRRMAFASRDPIVNEVFKLTAPRGFCETVRVKSRMQDGCLVVDGSMAYKFSMGTVAVARIAPSSRALRTISFFKPSELHPR